MKIELCRTPHREAMEFYQAAFPHWERRTEQRHNEILTADNFLPYHIIDGEKFIGLLYCWQWGELVFVEHLATRPELRGAGYGARAIEELKKAKHDAVIILEIEPPTTQIAARREGFYLRQGFIENHYEHIHPSYSEPKKPHRLIVMSYPRAISRNVFEQFRKQSFAVL